jgi:uncharacterized protein YbjT (DUF2867 family)
MVGGCSSIRAHPEADLIRSSHRLTDTPADSGASAQAHPEERRSDTRPSSGSTYTAAADGRVAMMDACDVAVVAVAALTSDGMRTTSTR